MQKTHAQPEKHPSVRYQELKEQLEEALGWKPGEASTLSPGMLRDIVRSSRAPGVQALREEFLRLSNLDAQEPVWLGRPESPRRRH